MKRLLLVDDDDELVAVARARLADVTRSVRAWVAHAAHAQSVGLRRSVLSGR